MNDERNHNDINIQIDNKKFTSFGINKDKIGELLNAYFKRGKTVELLASDYECELIAGLGKEEGIAQKLCVSLTTGLKTETNDKGPVVDKIERVNGFDENVDEDESIPNFFMFVWDSLGDLIIKILIVIAIIQIILGIILRFQGSPYEWIDVLLILPTNT